MEIIGYMLMGFGVAILLAVVCISVEEIDDVYISDQAVRNADNLRRWKEKKG